MTRQMPDSLHTHLVRLHRLGAARIQHKNGTLLQHLQGTWSLLRGWGNEEAVCVAGLYHSIYGTGGFEGQLVALEQRQRIRELIGEKAEQLVYLFGACDRQVTHPRVGRQTPLLFRDRFTGRDASLTPEQWQAQCEIMLANEIDLGLHNPAFYRKHLAHYQDLFARFSPWLTAGARDAHALLSREVSSPGNPDRG